MNGMNFEGEARKEIYRLTLGERIAYYRKKNNWSQLDLSLMTGITRDQISRLELDKNSPRLETIERLEEAFCLPRWALLEDIKKITQKNYYSDLEYEEFLEHIIAELRRWKLTINELEIIEHISFSLIDLFKKRRS